MLLTTAPADEPASEDERSPRQRWYDANADFTEVPQYHVITRQFEMYNPHSREQLESLKQMGFTQVILDWQNLHTDAAQVGLDVVLANWWTDKSEPQDFDYGFELAAEADKRRFVGLSVMDEPERNSPDTPLEFYEELYKELKPRLDRAAPRARLEISHWGPSWNWSEELYEAFAPLYRSADVMRIMPYPDLHEGPLSDVYFMMARSRRLMLQAGKPLPLLVILQTWTLTPESDLPTIDELRVMAYQAMLCGAETVSFFDYNQEIWDKAPGFHAEFAGLMDELTSLSRRLGDASLVTTMSTTGIVQTTATLPTGEVRMLRVNTNRTATDEMEPLAVVESAVCPCRTGRGVSHNHTSPTARGCVPSASRRRWQGCRPRR